MQTLKTATIVALLMTVMYGGYVSLTTPPERIPAEYRDLLVIDDGLGMDTGFPSAGSIPGPSEFQPTFAASADTAVNALPGSQTAFGRATSSINETFNNTAPTFAAPANSNPTQPAATISLGPASGHQSSNGSQTRNTPVAPAQLPQVSTPARTVSVDMNQSFQSTQRDFQMPGPADSQSSFDPNRGRAFGVPNALPTQVQPPSMNGLPSMDSLPDLDATPGFGASFGDSANMDVPQTKQISLQTDPYVPEVVPPAAEAPDSTFAAQPVAARIPRPSRNVGLDNAIEAADRQYRSDQVLEALSTLSVFYDTPSLLPEQRKEMLSRLDPLARDVIYSERHLMDQPHRVGNDETLMEIADRYQVPWQLLANINGIQDPLVVHPGTDLKVVRGPFSARIDLSDKELTLFAGDLYAGRFPIEVGDSPMPRPGTFTVQDKQTRKPFQDGLGNAIPSGSPGNPYGKMWIGLGSQMSIHGSPSETVGTNQGCISLPGELADDLFGILVQGSSVTIRN